MTIFDDWQDGIIANTVALWALTRELGEVESQLAPLEAERTALRDQLSQILARLDEPVAIPGFSKLELTAPSVMKSYDKQRLNELLIALAIEAPDVARRLVACRVESARAGSLRITRERGTK